MEGCIFLADAPEQLPEGGESVSRVQIAKTGNFKDPRYGKFSITSKDFSKWMSNFKDLILDNGREGLPVDRDHSPEKKGETEAVGWVKALDTLGKDGQTETPGELWATVEWNSLGQELISDRRYAYLSPSYQFNFEDETGRKHGTALVGIGLTNRPFLTMPVISLSAAEPFAEEVAPVNTPAPRKQDGDPADRQGGMETTALIAALEEKGIKLDSDASEETILESLKTLAVPEEPKEGEITLSQVQVTKLVEDAKAGEKALSELSDMRFETAYDKALDEARVAPAQKDSLKALYDKDAETVLTLMKDAPQLVKTEAKGGTGHGAQVGDVVFDSAAPGTQVDADRLQLAADAEALAASEKIDFIDAVERLQAERGVA